MTEIFFQLPYAKMWSSKSVNKIFPLQWITNRCKTLIANFSFKNQNEENTFGASMAIFPLTNKNIQTCWLFIHLPLKKHVERIECWPFTHFVATANCFKSPLYLLLCPTEKLPFGSLLYMHVQNDLDGSPSCLHQATTVQYFSFQFL